MNILEHLAAKETESFSGFGVVQNRVKSSVDVGLTFIGGPET